MKRIAFLIGFMLILGTIFVYGQSNSNESKNETGEVDWVKKYQDAYKGGNINGVFEAAQNIAKQKINNIAFERLLAIAKDKTMTSDGEINFRTMTIELIGKLKDERVFNELKNIAEDEEQVDIIRAYAIQRMTDASKDKKVFDYLISKLTSPVPMIRTSSVNGLIALGNVEAGPYIMPLLKDKDEMTRIVATRALGAIKYKDAVDELIQELITKQEKGTMKETITGIAAEALGQIGDAKAIEPLIGVLLDKNQEDFIRGMVAKALTNFKDERVTDALIKVVEEHSYNSIAAAEVLGEIGDTRATEAIRKVIEQETDSFAVSKYREAYKKITGKDYVEKK